MHGECLLQILGSNCPSLTPSCVSQRGAHCTCTQIQSHKWQKSSSLRFPSCASIAQLKSPSGVQSWFRLRKVKEQLGARNVNQETCYVTPLLLTWEPPSAAGWALSRPGGRIPVWLPGAPNLPRSDWSNLRAPTNKLGAPIPRVLFATLCAVLYQLAMEPEWPAGGGGRLLWTISCPASVFAQAAHSIQVELIGKGRGMLSPLEPIQDFSQVSEPIQDQSLSRTLSIPGFSQSQGTPYPLSQHGLGEYQPAGNGKIHWGQIVLDLKL